MMLIITLINPSFSLLSHASTNGSSIIYIAKLKSHNEAPNGNFLTEFYSKILNILIILIKMLIKNEECVNAL